MKFVFSRSAATRASLRSTSARSARLASVTSAKVRSVAPSGSGIKAKSMTTPSARVIWPVKSSRSSRKAVTDLPIRSHVSLSGCSVCAAAITSPICGISRELARRHPPDLAEGLVEELQASVRAENHDALFEAVECLALHVDEGIVAALERDALRLVGEQIRDAAVGPLLGHDMHDAAVRQVPSVLERRPGPIASENLRLPIAMADDRLQNADFAEPVENGAVARTRGEPVGIERPQLDESRH